MNAYNYIKLNLTKIPLYVVYVLLAPFIVLLMYKPTLPNFLLISAVFVQFSSINFHATQLMKMNSECNYRVLDIYYNGFRKYFIQEVIRIYIWSLISALIFYLPLININLQLVIVSQIYMLSFSTVMVLLIQRIEKTAIRNYVSTLVVIFGIVLLFQNKLILLVLSAFIYVIIVYLIIKRKVGGLSDSIS